MDIPFDKERFRVASDAAVSRECGALGIGTLGEKTLHAAVKRYIDPDEAHHEVKLGRAVADIYDGSRIFEIQTRSFERLRSKLSKMLDFCPLTVVYPITHVKRLIWINKATGEATAPRKSPKIGRYQHAFRELYKLGELISDGRLTIALMLIDLDEYRLLDGWSADGKKGSTRFERIPRELISIKTLASREDYSALLPDGLGAEFTSREVASLGKLRLEEAQVMLRVLAKLGAVELERKEGSRNIYRRASEQA